MPDQYCHICDKGIYPTDDQYTRRYYQDEYEHYRVIYFCDEQCILEYLHTPKNLR
jgi:hypothetical protein